MKKCDSCAEPLITIEEFVHRLKTTILDEFAETYNQFSREHGTEGNIEHELWWWPELVAWAVHTGHTDVKSINDLAHHLVDVSLKRAQDASGQVSKHQH